MNNQTVAELSTLRRDIHRHPEPRFTEHRTSSLLRSRLIELGFEVQPTLAGTGVVASVGDGETGPHVVLRADMDALPTQDLKSVEYASTAAGVAHACGHDVHCAVVLGAARLLLDRNAVQGGRLTVLYQPAEEIPYGESSGAQAMLDAGTFEGSAPDAILAVHCWPQLPAGTIGLDVQTAMAAKQAFKISVHGKGAHAATPQLGRDALLGASQMVIALHTLLGREIEPGERAALNVGTVKSGSSQSIVAPAAELSGTVRTVDNRVGARLKASIERVAGGVSSAYGLTAEVEWKNEMPRVHNDPRLVDLAAAVLGECDAVDNVVTIHEPPMTSDDFALYAERWPGLYMKLGVAAPGAASWPSLHDGRFDVDENCLATGAQALARVAAEVLRRGLPAQSPVNGRAPSTRPLSDVSR